MKLVANETIWTHCAVPSTNPTRPGEPTGFSVTPRLGYLQFTISEPVVRPFGTRYQILQSPGTLAVAGSFSVVWEGVADNVELPADPRSLFWYHGRAISNSYASALLPNTHGIGTRPWIPAESVPGNRAYPDGEFMFAIDSYVAFRGTGLPVAAGSALVSSGGVSGSRGKYVWKVNSGVTGGLGIQLCPLRWDVDSRTSNFGPRMFPGQTGVAYVTARNVGTPWFTPSVLAFGFLPSSSGAQPTEVTIGSQAVTLSGSGEWVTTVYTFTMPSSQFDHARIAFRGPTSHVGTQGCVELGAIQLAIF